MSNSEFLIILFLFNIIITILIHTIFYNLLNKRKIKQLVIALIAVFILFYFYLIIIPKGIL